MFVHLPGLSESFAAFDEGHWELGSHQAHIRLFGRRLCLRVQSFVPLSSEPRHVARADPLQSREIGWSSAVRAGAESYNDRDFLRGQELRIRRETSRHTDDGMVILVALRRRAIRSPPADVQPSRRRAGVFEELRRMVQAKTQADCRRPSSVSTLQNLAPVRPQVR